MIVVIDDLDRLNVKEIRQIFQLVKKIGDFKNTIYLLAFDKEIICSALEGVQNTSGEEYLEKIIQIPFETPKVSKSKVENVLFEGLNEIVKDIPEGEWNSVYWGNIYHSGLKYLISNLRDVTRFLNTLRFEYSIVKDEVNTIDFIALTAIQVFLPDLYKGIRDNTDIFAGISSRHYGYDRTYNEELKKRCDRIINDNYKISQKQQIDLLKRLFPKLESVYGNTDYGSDWLSEWRKDKRACVEEKIDTYFKLSINEGSVKSNKIKLALASESVETLTTTLLSFNDAGIIHDFLDRASDFIDKPSFDQSIIIMASLLNVVDIIEESRDTSFGRDKNIKVLRIVLRLCSEFDTQEERYNLLRHAFFNAENSLYGTVMVVHWLDREHGRFVVREQLEPLEKRTVNTRQLLQLESYALHLIKSKSKLSNFKSHANFATILYRWKKWGREEEVNHFIAIMIESKAGLVTFLDSMLIRSTTQSISDYVASEEWNINIESLSDYYDISILEAKARDLVSNPEYIGNKGRDSVQIFLDTLDGKVDVF